MKRILYLFYIGIILQTLLTACTRQSWNKELAEQIALCTIEYPDSALSMLHAVRNPKKLPEEAQAYHALLSLEAEYAKKRTINDSILEISYTYYVTENAGDKNQRLRTLMFRAVSLYNKREISEALKLLLEVNENINLLKHPYLKGIVQFYIGMIHTDNGMRKEAHNYFRAEKNYAIETNKAESIVNSDHHYAISFLYLDQPDSALYYIKHSINYLHQLDSFWISMVYHNLGLTMQFYFPDSLNIVEDYMQKSLLYGINSKDSLRTYSVLTDYYYKTDQPKRADSLMHIIELKANDKEVLYTVYKSSCMYYKNRGDFDLAYTYSEKAANTRYSILSSRQTKEVASIKAQYEYERKSKKTVLKAIVLFFILIIIILFLIGNWIKRKLKEKKLLEKIINYKTLITNLDTNLCQLGNEKEELTKQKKLLEETFKEENKAWMIKHNDLSQKLRELIQTQKKLIIEKQGFEQQCSKLENRLKGFKPPKTTHSKFTKESRDFALGVLAKTFFPTKTEFRPYVDISSNDYDFFVEGYSRVNKEKKKFIELLYKHSPNLSMREIFICILYNEGYTDDKQIASTLKVSYGTFRTAKSRIKSTLTKVETKEIEVKNLITLLS